MKSSLKKAEIIMTNYQIGQSASFEKCITDEEVRKFAEISGDDNPVHLDEEYAKNSLFGRRIVHGILVSGLISKVIGTQLPGNGTIYLSQNLKFLKPVYVGETVKAEVVIKDIVTEKCRIVLETKVYRQNAECVLTGEALVMLPEEK